MLFKILELLVSTLLICIFLLIIGFIGISTLFLSKEILSLNLFLAFEGLMGVIVIGGLICALLEEKKSSKAN